MRGVKNKPIFIYLSFAVILCCVILTTAAKEEDWKGWSCDDMTPNLCENLKVTHGSFDSRNGLKIHYWRYTSSSNAHDETKYPVIVVNGGPGMPHDYSLPLRQLACSGREVIFYDQGGTGESALPPNTTVTDDYPFLLDASYYANEEFPALVKKLDVTKYHVISDSWGTMISMKSAIESPNPNLLSLSLNGPIPKLVDYVDKAWDPVEGSIGTLPNYIKSRMRSIEASGDFDSEEMQEITTVVLSGFYSRNGLFPDCVIKAFMGTNEQVSAGMWAEVDFFNITGTLADFDLYPDLRKGALNDIPILLTSGKYDMVRPTTVNALHELLPLSEKILFAQSGHDSLFDATEELLDAEHDFLNRVELAESNEHTVFAPKRVEEAAQQQEETVRGMALQYAIAVVVLIITFILGFAFGQRRGMKRSHYSALP